MKRDMDLIREVLQSIEAMKWEDGEPPVQYWAKTPDEAYQIVLMKDAGLVEAAIDTTNGIPSGATVTRLTWAGHEFLEAARDNAIWKKAKEHVLKPGMSWTFQILGEFLKQEIGRRVLHTPAS